ncbi:MAG: hypothetical protein QXE57_05040 [Nitrososphaerales archaeon]
MKRSSRYDLIEMERKRLENAKLAIKAIKQKIKEIERAQDVLEEALLDLKAEIRSVEEEAW